MCCWQEMVSKGNLAEPEKITQVTLKKPILASLIRFTPTVWSGVPFMSVTVIYCSASDEMVPNQQTFITSKGQ